MPTKIEKRADHFAKHFTYEVEMLRTYHERLNTADQLTFNVFLEGFAVHARLLTEFLTNEKDSRNYRAEHYAKAYRAGDRSTIKDLGQWLDAQIFHFGKNRQTDVEKKVSREKADDLLLWINVELDRFSKALDEPQYKTVWSAFEEALRKPRELRIAVLPDAVAATNQSTHTASGSVLSGPVFPASRDVKE